MVCDVIYICYRFGFLSIFSSYAAEILFHYIIRVYILQKREIKVGDKVAGRRGNKGIISKILLIQDMPYLQDGRPTCIVSKVVTVTIIQYCHLNVISFAV